MNPGAERRPRSVRLRLEIIALRATMVLAALNLWTGAPLLGLWVGSRVVSSSKQITMGAVGLIVATILAASLALIHVLSAASAAHDDLLGRQRSVRRHVPWLRSMRGERVEWERERIRLTAMEQILVVVVILAVIAFEAWFFLASPSPIDPGPSKD